MLHKIDVGDDKVVGFRWEGKYDEKGVKQSFVQFLPELQARSEMNLYLEVGSLTEVEAKAIWEEIRFDIKNLQQIVKKIDKVSLVTDMNWMRTMAETSSSLVPGISLKAFSFKDTDAARAFVTNCFIKLAEEKWIPEQLYSELHIFLIYSILHNINYRTNTNICKYI